MIFHDAIAWLGAPLLHVASATLSPAELLGFGTGAWCVWLVARQDVLNWPVGIANNLFFLVLFLASGLYADAGLQVVYVGLAGYGWWAWAFAGRSGEPRRDPEVRGGEGGGDEGRGHEGGEGAGGMGPPPSLPMTRTPLPVTHTPPRTALALLFAMLAATGGLTLLLARWTDSTVPFWDALTTAISLAATYGQCRKQLESWWLWMAADLVYVPLYLYKGLWLTSLLYAGFFALCVVGFVSWRREVVGGGPPGGHGDRRGAAA